jgi:hypothetical protein
LVCYVHLGPQSALVSPDIRIKSNQLDASHFLVQKSKRRCG